jgi:hypothetical protein
LFCLSIFFNSGRDSIFCGSASGSFADVVSACEDFLDEILDDGIGGPSSVREMSASSLLATADFCTISAGVSILLDLSYLCSCASYALRFFLCFFSYSFSWISYSDCCWDSKITRFDLRQSDATSLLKACDCMPVSPFSRASCCV